MPTERRCTIPWRTWDLQPTTIRVSQTLNATTLWHRKRSGATAPYTANLALNNNNNNDKHICIAPPFKSEDTEALVAAQEDWTEGFSSSVWKWEYFRTVECQRVESSRWTEQQQRKRNGPVRCVCASNDNRHRFSLRVLKRLEKDTCDQKWRKYRAECISCLSPNAPTTTL